MRTETAAKSSDDQMTYDEYLRRFSTPEETHNADSDDPDQLAENLAKLTIAAFEAALSKK